jgi:hypothetical protein
MITEQIYGKYFKLTDGSTMKCSCCGKEIKKGFSVLGTNLGEDCYESITMILGRNIVEGSGMAKVFQVQKKHFAWINNR